MIPASSQSLSRRLHVDMVLLLALLLLSGVGLVILYSAGNQDIALIQRQLLRLAIAFFVMFVVAQINPDTLLRWSPWLYGIGMALLFAVLVLGVEGKGAQRWLDLGFIRFQPSEMMKLAVPMMVAWYLSEHPLPPRPRQLVLTLAIIVVPTLLIAKQPDLGTALLIACSGLFVLLFASISWRLVTFAVLFLVPMALLLWKFGMHDYQRQRVLTFINPESDPLGSGYHIIQSKIAIGSGGLYGKGWLNGTQSHLEFLPERSTDFIFAVFGEEFGLIGSLLLLSLYLFIIIRGLIISLGGQDSYARLLCGGLVMTFMVYVFINVGMVIGLLPVVGLPLPLMSYGGTAMVTIMAAFGILMSVYTHRKLLK